MGLPKRDVKKMLQMVRLGPNLSTTQGPYTAFDNSLGLKSTIYFPNGVKIQVGG